jgi:hypothetical protein
MPVIAINVSKKVYDAYHQIKSGKRSERMNNALERHFRIEHQNPRSHIELETKLLELQDNINKLQDIILKTNEEKDKLRDLALKQQEYLNQSWLSNILRRRRQPSDELIQ